MNVPFVALNEQYLAVETEVTAAIQKVLRSGDYILGKHVADFEEQVADYCGVSHAIGVNSGTDALELSLLACGVSLGDEVISVANSFFATVEAISSIGAIPIFVDVDERTYCIDVCKIEEAITARTKVIIPVHLFGHPADMHALLTVARRHNLVVIEDACQAFGAKYQGARVGSIGDLGCFSFVPTKPLGGYGDGGMVITNDKTLATKVRLLRNHGMTGVGVYYHEMVGRNSRLDALQAAVLSVKLRHLDEWNVARREAASAYSALLKGTALILPCEIGDVYHVYYLYVIRSRARDELQQWLASHGIDARVHYPLPIHLQKPYNEHRVANLSKTNSLCTEILSLPISPHIRADQIEYVAEAISEFLCIPESS